MRSQFFCKITVFAANSRLINHIVELNTHGMRSLLLYVDSLGQRRQVVKLGRHAVDLAFQHAPLAVLLQQLCTCHTLLYFVLTS